MKYIATTIFVLLLTACDVNVSNRSGNLDDDYLEEPLSSTSEKYRKALETSNLIIDKLSVNEYDFVYSNLIENNLKNELSSGAFKQLILSINKDAGTIKNFKPNQWSFFTRKEDNPDLLYSVKIVEHENIMMKYLFVFDIQGQYTKIIGMHTKVRDGVSVPGSF